VTSGSTDIAPVLDACCCTARMAPTGYPSCGPSHSNSGQHLGYREIRVERGEGLTLLDLSVALPVTTQEVTEGLAPTS
jgi:hypothetical protein